MKDVIYTSYNITNVTQGEKRMGIIKFFLKVLLTISISFTISNADLTSSIASGLVQGLIQSNQAPPPKQRYQAPRAKKHTQKKGK